MFWLFCLNKKGDSLCGKTIELCKFFITLLRLIPSGSIDEVIFMWQTWWPCNSFSIIHKGIRDLTLNSLLSHSEFFLLLEPNTNVCLEAGFTLSPRLALNLWSFCFSQDYRSCATGFAALPSLPGSLPMHTAATSLETAAPQASVSPKQVLP